MKHEDSKRTAQSKARAQMLRQAHKARRTNAAQTDRAIDLLARELGAVVVR